MLQYTKVSGLFVNPLLFRCSFEKRLVSTKSTQVELFQSVIKVKLMEGILFEEKNCENEDELEENPDLFFDIENLPETSKDQAKKNPLTYFLGYTKFPRSDEFFLKRRRRPKFEEPPVNTFPKTTQKVSVYDRKETIYNPFYFHSTVSDRGKPRLDSTQTILDEKMDFQRRAPFRGKNPTFDSSIMDETLRARHCLVETPTLHHGLYVHWCCGMFFWRFFFLKIVFLPFSTIFSDMLLLPGFGNFLTFKTAISQSR